MTFRTLLLAVFACVVFTGPTQAQLRLIPQVGVYAPLSDLPPVGDAVEVGDRESTLAYGAALELGDGEQTASLRVSVLVGTNSKVPVEGVGCEQKCYRSSVTAATAQLALRPFPLPVLRPYFLVGGGLRRLAFDREEGLGSFFDDQSDFAFHGGVGVELNVAVLQLRAELSDVVSLLEVAGSDDELLHDMFFMLGLVIG